MKKLLPRSSTILFIFISLFLLSIFISYKLLLKNLEDNHIKNQQLTFNLIQRESSYLLTKLLYEYTQQKNLFLKKHIEVLDYLKDTSYDNSLEDIYNKLNENISTKPYNVYITDENLTIVNTTFKPDLGFNLSFAKDLFEKHRKEKIIGISPPVFEMYSMKFFSFTDSFLPKNSKRLMQISYIYENLNNDLKKLQLLIDENKNIKASNAYLVFSDGYVGDFIFKSIKPHKPTLEEINERIKKGRELSNSIPLGENQIQFYNSSSEFKNVYFMEKSPVYNDAKIVYSLTFDEKEFKNDILRLNLWMLIISFIGIITIYLIYRVRYKEKLLKYKDKFIEHSVHEIKTPLSIISLNVQLRNKVFGEDKYSSKIEGALKTLENSYDDMTFLHTKDKIDYPIENIDLGEILKNRIEYFKVIASTQCIYRSIRTGMPEFNRTLLQ